MADNSNADYDLLLFFSPFLFLGFCSWDFTLGIALLGYAPRSGLGLGFNEAREAGEVPLVPERAKRAMGEGFTFGISTSTRAPAKIVT